MKMSKSYRWSKLIDRYTKTIKHWSDCDHVNVDIASTITTQSYEAYLDSKESSVNGDASKHASDHQPLEVLPLAIDGTHPSEVQQRYDYGSGSAHQITEKRDRPESVGSAFPLHFHVLHRTVLRKGKEGKS